MDEKEKQKIYDDNKEFILEEAKVLLGITRGVVPTMKRGGGRIIDWPKRSDVSRLPLYGQILATYQLLDSSKKLEKLTWWLIGLTIILTILTATLILRTLGIV